MSLFEGGSLAMASSVEASTSSSVSAAESVKKICDQLVCTMKDQESVCVCVCVCVCQ